MMSMSQMEVGCCHYHEKGHITMECPQLKVNEVGKVEIKFVNDHLEFNGGSNYSMTLEHWHYDTFKGKPKPWSDPSFVKFELDISGKITGLEIGGNASYRKIPNNSDIHVYSILH